jgi:Toxic anion resistance protein (TelA)
VTAEPDGPPTELEQRLATDIEPEVAAKVEAVATEFVGRLMSAPIGTPAFDRSLRAIDGLGEREVRATTIIASRFGDRPVRDVEDLLSERASLSRHLRGLREAAAQLIRRNDGDRPADALARDVADVEDRIRGLVTELEDDRAVLEADNAALAQHEQALWREIETLRQYAFLAGRLDDLVADRLDNLARSDPSAAKALQVEALYAIRRRRRDLLLQLAVATQGYAALRLIEQDNLQIIWAIRAATSTTVSALRTALLASQAASDRSEAVASAASEAIGELRGTMEEMVRSLEEVDRRRRTTLEEVHRRPHG